MSRLITVTARHRRFQSTALIMCLGEDNQEKWRKWQVKYQSFSTYSQDDTLFQNDLLLSFSLCGCKPSLWVVQGGTRKEVAHHLRNTPIPEDIRLCQLKCLGKAPGSLELHIRDDCTTYGQLFELWGVPVSHTSQPKLFDFNPPKTFSDVVKTSKRIPLKQKPYYYEYPDKYRLELERFDPSSKRISVVSYKQSEDCLEDQFELESLRLFRFGMDSVN